MPPLVCRELSTTSLQLRLEITGDCWSLGRTLSLRLPMGNVCISERRTHEQRIYLHVTVFPVMLTLKHLSRYVPVTIYATVSKDQVELVDFRLTRVHADSNGKSPNGLIPMQTPSEKEFQDLIRELSIGQGLEKLVKSTATENNLRRYRGSKELSSYLRSFTLNFPDIIHLHRWASSIKPSF